MRAAKEDMKVLFRVTRGPADEDGDEGPKCSAQLTGMPGEGKRTQRAHGVSDRYIIPNRLARKVK